MSESQDTDLDTDWSKHDDYGNDTRGFSEEEKTGASPPHESSSLGDERVTTMRLTISSVRGYSFRTYGRLSM